MGVNSIPKVRPVREKTLRKKKIGPRRKLLEIISQQMTK